MLFSEYIVVKRIVEENGVENMRNCSIGVKGTKFGRGIGVNTLSKAG